MEKYLKKLSIIISIMTTFLFLNAYGAAMAEETNSPQIIARVMIVGANVLFFLVPIMYLIIFGIVMNALFKRVLRRQSSEFEKETDKFPKAWFILSTVCFVLYYTFFSVILS